MNRLEGKTALITGAASGIGMETAKLFASEGAKVLVVDVNDSEGEQTAAAIRDSGGEALYQHADVSSSSETEAMIRKAEEKFRALHIIFNNAGIMDSRDDNAMVTEEDVWDLTMAINLKGVFLGCKFGIPALQRAGGGAIINTASFVGLMGAATPQIAYTASKGGVIALTRELAVIHARENIRGNFLIPKKRNNAVWFTFLWADLEKPGKWLRLPYTLPAKNRHMSLEPSSWWTEASHQPT